MIPRINKWNYKKLASFCTAGEINRQMPRELISMIYKKLQKLNIKDTKLPINKWDNEMNR